MPLWLLLLLAGGTGYYFLSKESTSKAPEKPIQPPAETSRVYQAPPETAKAAAPSVSERAIAPAEVVDSGIRQRAIIDRAAHWPAGDVCEAALSGLPYDKRANAFTGKYTDPSIREIALEAASNDDIAGLQRAADLAESPEYADAYKFAIDCLRKRAVALGG